MLKVFVYIELLFRNGKIRLKGWFLKIYLQLHGCKIGKNIRCYKWPYFRTMPYKNYEFGNNVYIGKDITFEIYDKGKIILGDHVNLTQNVVISSRNLISIGEFSTAAEYVSIRDSDHGFTKDKYLNSQVGFSNPIRIGQDVGIGYGSLILRGSEIPNRVVIGANSIVMRNQKLVENGIYFGNPLKLISKRR